MSITPADLGFYKPKTINDTATNGGRMSKNAFQDAALENIFPVIYLDNLASAQTHYRKMFLKVANDADIPATNARVAMLRPANQDDEVTFFQATQTDTQNDITGTEQQYGCGQLQADIIAGATTLTVTTEAGATRPIFDDGMLIMISNKTSVSSATGTREYVQLAATGAVSWTGNDATLTLAPGQSIQNAYLAADTYVSSAIDLGGIAGSSSAYSVTSSNGTFDDTGNPITVDAIGGIHENWTLTFTSATNYDLIGDTVGAVGSGTVSSDFSPNNPDFAKPYLTIPAAGFGGTFASGDQITFTTDPFAKAIWLKRYTPANAGAGQSDFILFMDVS